MKSSCYSCHPVELHSIETHVKYGSYKPNMLLSGYFSACVYKHKYAQPEVVLFNKKHSIILIQEQVQCLQV